MKSTEYWAPSSEPAVHTDRFEELRAAYYARLRSDLARLTALRVRFDETQGGDSLFHEEIRRVAHGMSGAAAMFEATQVAIASSRLEEAVRSSRRPQDTQAYAAVSAALDSLMHLLKQFGA